MYDKSSQSVLFTAFKAAREEVTISEDEMTLYHDCWYWGCDSICNDRYNINRALAFASCVASVMYLALATLSGIQSGFDSDYEEVPTDEMPTTSEISEAIKMDKLLVDRPETPKTPKTPETDTETLEEGNQAVNSGAASGDGSPKNEWNFRLRM
jgi:hypothetical protein